MSWQGFYGLGMSGSRNGRVACAAVGSMSGSFRGKKIDCLTTINLVNLKSNTMKNTMQR